MQTEQSPRAEFRRPITVVLVDDEQLIRGAIAQALSSSGLELVGEAANGEDAIEIVVDVHPDVVLMDLRLPGISGVEAIEQLGLLAPASRVLVLTRSEQNRVVEAIIAGASGYQIATTSGSARIPSPTTSPASSPSSTSRTASKQPSKPYAAASPNQQRVTVFGPTLRVSEALRADGRTSGHRHSSRIEIAGKRRKEPSSGAGTAERELRSGNDSNPRWTKPPGERAIVAAAGSFSAGSRWCRTPSSTGGRRSL
jgi:chemotaxis response regulator CheB